MLGTLQSFGEVKERKDIGPLNRIYIPERKTNKLVIIALCSKCYDGETESIKEMHRRRI